MIDYNTRKMLIQLMDNKQVKWMDISMEELTLIDLMYLFETVCNEMYMLMIDSYQRFAETNHYEKLNKLAFVC